MTKATTHRCPECGRTFDRAASLGVHRRRSHGVAGTSRPGRTSSARSRRAARDELAAGVVELDRDALLRALFPAGLPASATLLSDVHAWLAEAERIVASRADRRATNPA